MDIFHSNPTLAYPVLNKKTTSQEEERERDIIMNREKCDNINNKYDWNKKEFY